MAYTAAGHQRRRRRFTLMLILFSHMVSEQESSVLHPSVFQLIALRLVFKVFSYKKPKYRKKAVQSGSWPADLDGERGTKEWLR